MTGFEYRNIPVESRVISRPLPESVRKIFARKFPEIVDLVGFAIDYSGFAMAAIAAGVSSAQSQRICANLSTKRFDVGNKTNCRLTNVRTARGGRGGSVGVYARIKRPVEERFGIQHEKNVTPERLKELGMERWSSWECGPGVTYRHEWKVDELVYIAKGSVMVSPAECEDDAYFYQGDLVRFPKWLVACLTFDEDYEQRYKYLAYASLSINNHQSSGAANFGI
ncbi:hypothetical protein R1sor_021879 [Riccia sorocarpa]|uniref:(S)-ureidoglycine aminohydrolase cupin domain-containing protein n=1 Tax=Riccia sorocarpa TaxID=122646 RepID=A0ABD3GJ05_9MARC